MGKMIKTFISVVISLYNKEKYIARCVSSVLSQDYPNFEVVVVDDGSTDGSLEVVKTIRDPKIKVIHKQNGGESSARNLGIKEAQGEIIAFLDADDCWLEGFLSKIISLVEEFPEAMVYATAVYNNNGKRFTYPHLDKLFKKDWKGFISPMDLFFRGIPFNSSSIAIRKSVFLMAGFFDEEMKIGGDINMWMRLSLLVPIVYSHTYLSEVFVNAENRSNYEKSPLTGSYLINKSIRDVRGKKQNLSEFTIKTIEQIEKKQTEYFNIEAFLNIGKNCSKSKRGKLLISEFKRQGFVSSLLTTTILSMREKLIFILRSIFWILDYVFHPKEWNS